MLTSNPRINRRIFLASASAMVAAPALAETTLGVSGGRFMLQGKPTFLLGISYYGGLGATERILAEDLAEMRRRKLNWLRVWATWDAFGNEPALTPEGAPREPALSRLKALISRLDTMGMVADVTLSRGKTLDGSQWFPTHEAHRRAVETVVSALKPWRNWYLDLSNERSVRDSRYTGFEELKALRERVRALDTARLVTASDGGDIDEKALKAYVEEVEVDFLAPHRPRDAESPGNTEATTRSYLRQIEGLGRKLPVHYQEPFRRGYGAWEPTADDFARDLAGARAGGAAGWCLHNGDQRKAPDHQPRRSFDLRERGLFAQLDAEERAFLDRLSPKRRHRSQIG